MHAKTQPNIKSDSATVRAIYDEVLVHSPAYQWLDYLTNEIGGRLSGSPEAERAVKWSKAVMDTLGFDSVWLQPVMVPHWVRGEKEVGYWMGANGERHDVHLTALGGSVGTNGLLSGAIIEAHSFEELAELGESKIRGKIVFFNVPMDQRHVNTFHAYGESVKYRVRGASEAAKYGASGMILRSLGTETDTDAHTGVMFYSDDESIPKIPAAAISVVDAIKISKALRQGETHFYLRMSCQTFPDVLSHNVIGEIKGSTYPDEVVLVGGHIDAWDNGDGAHDDGAGCVQSMEVARAFTAMGIRPKRTLRVVMFMNEENGSRGGRKYADESIAQGLQHVAALESDAGGFTPRGFGIQGTDAQVSFVQSITEDLAAYGLHEIQAGYGGVDIRFLAEQGTTLIGLRPDTQRYFDHHHAPSDTFDKVNRRELLMGAASMTALIWKLTEHGALVSDPR